MNLCYLQCNSNEAIESDGTRSPQLTYASVTTIEHHECVADHGETVLRLFEEPYAASRNLFDTVTESLYCC